MPPAPQRTPWLPRAALPALLALGASGCVYTATELRVVVNTDVDPGVPFTLTVDVTRGRDGGGAPVMHRTFHRAPPEATGPDAGFTFPASFTVVPGDTPRDGTVRIEVGADAGGVLLKRVVVASFTPRHAGLIRIFLASRCADPAEGCSTPVCTVRQFCEERGLTCGDLGTCVPLELDPSPELDAGWDDVASRPSCGGAGQACCSVGTACAGGLACVAGQCTSCPAGSEACCEGGLPRSDGTDCAPAPDACHSPGTCTGGVCNPPRPLPDETECAPPAGPCGLPSVCRAGACTSRAVPDGTVCAMGTGGCVRDGVCMGGACTGTTPLPDGTVCAMADNPCQRNGTCSGGVCSGTTAAPDGTVCEPATACRQASVCVGGACTRRPLANGTVCAPTTNPCRRPGTCTDGVCGPITNRADGTICAPQDTAACDAARRCSGGVCQPAAPLPDGTTCRAAANECQFAARCSGGSCPPNPTRQDNYVISGTQRCCNGRPTSVTTEANCGVCGLRCNGGSCVGRSLSGHGTRYFCTCSSNSQCSPLTTCRTQTPNAWVCSCNNNAECPGNAGCVDVSFNPNYCN